MACFRRRGSPFRAGLLVGLVAAGAYAFFGPWAPWRSSRSRGGVYATSLRVSDPAKPVLQGLVVDKLGHPIPGATIRVEPSEGGGDDDLLGGEVREVSLHGAFAFTRLDPGSFEVTASAPGYGDRTAGPILLGGRNPSVNLRFVLEPRAAGAEDLADQGGGYR